VAAILAASVLLAGCFEVKQDTSLNPDGSGKAVVELTMPDMGAMAAGMTGMPGAVEKASPPDPEMALKKFAKQTLDDSKGVEAWSDVSLARTEDGRMKFKGTAYFKDLTKLQIANSKNDITWTKDEKGGMILKAAPPQDRPKPPAAKPEKPMTDEEIAQAVKEARDQYIQGRPMMEMVFSKMKMAMKYRLPGTLAEVNGFTREADGSVAFAFDGAKILETMDKLMADEAYLTACIKAGQKPGGDAMSPEIMEKTFGFKGDIMARVTGNLKPLFDYAAEVKAAKEAYPKMIEKLGLDKVPPPAHISVSPQMPPGMPPMPPAPENAPPAAQP